MKIRDKVIVVISFLLISVLGITLTINNEVRESNVNKKSKFTAFETSYGAIDSTLYFSTSSDYININNDDYEIHFTANNKSLAENEIDVHFYSVFNHEETYDAYAAGDILFVLPTTTMIFNNPDFEYYDINSTSNKVTFYTDENLSQVLGYIKLGAGVEYCDIDFASGDTLGNCSGNSNYYWFYNADGLVFVNGTEIHPTTTDYTVDLSATYAISTTDMIGLDNYLDPMMLILSDDTYFYDSYYVDVIESAEAPLSLDDVELLDEVVYTAWQDDWGNEGHNYDYYVKYPISGFIDYDNFYASFEITGSNNVVAFSRDDVLYRTGDEIDFTDLATCDVGASGYTAISCYIIVGYDVGNTPLSVEMSVRLTAEGVEKDFVWSHELEPKDDTVVPEYPAGTSADFLQVSTSPDAGEGAINKLLNGGSTNFSWLIEANGLASINNGYKAFNLWNLTNEGTVPYTVSISSNGEYIEGASTYNLNGNDYSIVSFYPQDDKEYNYVLDNGVYKLTPVTDYATYGAKEVYVSINNGTKEKIGSYVRTGSSIVYTADDSRTTNNNNVNESNPIILPANTTSVEVKYTGTKAAVYLGINVNTKINGTDAVKNKINGESSISLKNKSNRVYAGGTEAKETQVFLTKMEINSYATKTATVGDRIDEGKTDVISYVDKYYEQLNYNDETRSDALNMLPEQRNGVVYELLPAGAELYGNVTVKTIGNNGSCTINPTTQEHYGNTNRTLLTININNCSSNYYDTGSSIQSGFVVNYAVKYTSAANQSYGTSLNSDAMFVAAGELGNGYSSALEAPSTLFSDTSVKTIFDNLVNGDKNLLFTTNITTVESLAVTEGEYNKTVLNGAAYSSSTNVLESKTYTYKLQYSFTSAIEEITNVIMIDKLENASGQNPKFNGYLENVDVQYLQSLGVTPTVYYSIFDVNNNTFIASEWTTTKPEDVSTIKAIAVDCGSYVFRMGEAPEVLITMKAPNNYQENKAAYNESNIIFKYPGESNIKHLESDVTTVNLKKANITVSGTSNYGTGTSSNPALIDGPLSYTFTIKNNDTTNGFENLKVEVTLPDGLRSTSATQVGNKVYLDVASLAASETKNVTLNTEFVANVSNNSVYTTAYKLYQLDGLDYSGTTGYIYNKVVLPSIEAHKYVKTIDSVNFTDEADVLIKKDEEFSYRVTIRNTSSKIANHVIVKDTVPNGLSIVSSTVGNGTVAGNTITWDVDVNANSTLNIDYKVKLNTNATLGSIYRSSANVKLANPYITSSMIFDDDTNTISVEYQIASNVKVSNSLSGSLASSTKEFEYEVSFNGSSANAGRYNVYGANNQALTPLDINESGVGSYTFKLKGNENVTFKNLTGGINYTIKQKKETGYTTHVNVNESNDGNYVVTSGVTNEEGTVTYSFTNAYAAQGQATLNAKVTYDKDITDNMFKVLVDGVEKNIPASGVMPGVTKSYNNQVGNYTYIIKQVNTGLPKVSYDSTEFKAVVTVTDNGLGNLNTQVKYYKGSTEVNEVVFNNTYLPNGLTIKNVNNSEYVVPDKEFSYKIELHGPDGIYKVRNNAGSELEDLGIVEGYGLYNFKLLSNGSILIEDLPDNVTYTITQDKVEYYTTTSEDEFTSGDNNVSVSGVTVNGSKEIKFINKYETRATFEPEIKVVLEGKDLEEAEFKFKLIDKSSGPTNGYTSNALNDAEGNVLFKTIEFTRPGTYKYEIVQLNNGSNHILFDLSKILLTVTLTDNGDGTMNVESAYEYVNGMEYIFNKYSSEPIVPEEETKDTNPNTGNKYTIIIIALWIVAMLVIAGRWIGIRRKMNS